MLTRVLCFILTLSSATALAQIRSDFNWSAASTSAAPEPVVRLLTPQPTRPAAASEDAPDLESLLQHDDDPNNLSTIPVNRTITPGWWSPMVQSALRRTATPISVGLDDLLVRTLQHSRQIQVFAELPLIRETSIIEADAAFDWSAFLDSRWDDTSDPVGNALTAGPGINRFKDHNLTFNGGARKRTHSGGQFELAQKVGIQENNSTFFVPNNQATTRLVLSYTQPLMRGKGEAYNRSLVCLAGIDKQIADDEFRRQLQSHLLEVTRGYWALYLERGTFLQKLHLYARAKSIVARLEQRRAIDATESQVRSAQAALKERQADLARARTAIRNAEARLRSLVNDPELGRFEEIEIVPVNQPTFQTLAVDMRGTLEEAIQFRPEVQQAIKQIKASSVRCQMSWHELQPVLNLVTEAYVAGLEDQRDVAGAWGNQFDQGEPGYSIGLQFEVPISNRAARARHQRRRHELRQMKNQYSTALETVKLEVEVAVREIGTSQKELFSKEQAMQARARQLDYMLKRWKLLPGEDASASLTLENLLRGQEQLASTEFEFLQAQMTYNLALANLKRTAGTLLLWEGVQIGRYCDHGLPTQALSSSKRDNQN